MPGLPEKKEVVAARQLDPWATSRFLAKTLDMLMSSPENIPGIRAAIQTILGLSSQAEITAAHILEAAQLRTEGKIRHGSEDTSRNS